MVLQVPDISRLVGTKYKRSSYWKLNVAILDEDFEDNFRVVYEKAKERIERSRLKFPTTESTQTLFRQFESGYYDDKDDFVDENIEGQKCLEHGNEWSDDDPVENGWWFSNNIKISHKFCEAKRKENILSEN